jgi:hypothetical protein
MRYIPSAGEAAPVGEQETDVYDKEEERKFSGEERGAEGGEGSGPIAKSWAMIKLSAQMINSVHQWDIDGREKIDKHKEWKVGEFSRPQVKWVQYKEPAMQISSERKHAHGTAVNDRVQQHLLSSLEKKTGCKEVDRRRKEAEENEQRQSRKRGVHVRQNFRGLHMDRITTLIPPVDEHTNVGVPCAGGLVENKGQRYIVNNNFRVAIVEAMDVKSVVNRVLELQLPRRIAIALLRINYDVVAVIVGIIANMGIVSDPKAVWKKPSSKPKSIAVQRKQVEQMCHQCVSNVLAMCSQCVTNVLAMCC